MHFHRPQRFKSPKQHNETMKKLYRVNERRPGMSFKENLLCMEWQAASNVGELEISVL